MVTTCARTAETGQAVPRGLVRRQAMLDAATELFLEKGYEGTSLAEIVARSKGSRTTLYEQFGGKEGLLRAMVEEVTGQICPADIGAGGDAPFGEDSLVDLGLRFVHAALAPRAIAVFRILSTEGQRELFFDRGPRLLERLLAERFAALADAAATPVQLAQIYLGAVLGVLHPHRVLGLPVECEDLDAHVRAAVRVFLGGALRRRPSAPATP